MEARRGRITPGMRRVALPLAVLLLLLLLFLFLGAQWLLAPLAVDSRSAVQPAVATRAKPSQAQAPELESETAAQGLAENTAETLGAESRAAFSKPDPATLRIRVIDAFDKEPIVDARIKLDYGERSLERRTDELGICRAPRPSSRVSRRMRVEAPGHAHADLAGYSTKSVEVVLARCTDLFGQVLAADSGEPLPGVTISREHPDCAGCAPDIVSSAADGSYELPGVPLWSEGVLVIETPGFARAERPFVLRVGEPRTRQDIHLVRGREIAGRVVDWVSGEGLAGANLAGLVTDVDGRFQGRVLPGPANSPTELVVRAAEHAALRFQLNPTDEDELVLRLPRPAVIEGQLLDSDRQPVAVAEVSWTTRGPLSDPLGGAASSSLDELPTGWSYFLEGPTQLPVRDGSYRFEVLPWSLNIQLVANKYMARGMLSEFIARAGEPASVQHIDFVFPTPSSPSVKGPPRTFVTGKLTLNGGGSLAGTLHWSGPTSSGDKHFSASTFGVEVEPGDLTLSVSLDGTSKRLEGSEVKVHAPADRTTQVDLELEAPGATLSGSLRFEDGAPIPGGLVSATCVLAQFGGRASTWSRSATSDADGRYEILVSDLGLPYRVEATIPAHPARVRDFVLAGARDVDLLFERRYPAFVRCTDAGSGQVFPLGDALQLWSRGSDELEFQRTQPFSDATDPDGWSTLWLTSGEVDFLVWPAGPELADFGPCRIDDVSLAGEVPARVQLEVRPGLGLVLELDPDSGPLPADCEVLLLEQELLGTVGVQGGRFQSKLVGLADRRRVVFDSQGRARLEGLLPGVYRFASPSEDLHFYPDEFQFDEHTPPVQLYWRRE